MDILFATHNVDKFKELKKILSKENINLEYLSKYSKKVPIEDGKSFKQNSIIKAMSASNYTNWKFDCLADDSGLCIDDLEGAPGIYSSRWAYNQDYKKAFEKIRERFSNIGECMNGKQAKFVCFLVYLKKNKKKFFYQGILKGSLIYPPRGKYGFGYDPIFIPKGSNKTLSELGQKIKNSISHRRLAIDKFLEDQIND